MMQRQMKTIDQRSVELAVGTGLQILGPKAKTRVAVRDLKGVEALQDLLNAIATGQLMLVPLSEDKKTDKKDDKKTDKKDEGRKK